MLNTIMALWNQDHGESRQRVVKIVFTILFITGSASLFLFTLNSSAWSPFVGAQGQQTERQEQPTVRNSRGVAIAGNTPVGTSEIASVTPTAKKSSTKVMAQPSCVHAPDAVAQQRTTTIPQNVIIYPEKSSQGKPRSEQRHAHPKTVQIKKGKLHSGNRSGVRVIVPPVSHAKKTVPVAPHVSPIATSTIQPTAAPVATAEVIATTTPDDGTVVSNMPAIVSATSDVSVPSATSFTSSVRQGGALRTSASPLVKSDKKSSDDKHGYVHGNVECGRSTVLTKSQQKTLDKPIKIWHSS